MARNASVRQKTNDPAAQPHRREVAFQTRRLIPMLRGTLYSQREIWSLMLSMLRHPRRFFRDRRLLYLWYDGRR